MSKKTHPEARPPTFLETEKEERKKVEAALHWRIESLEQKLTNAKTDLKTAQTDAVNWHDYAKRIVSMIDGSCAKEVQEVINQEPPWKGP